MPLIESIRSGNANAAGIGVAAVALGLYVLYRRILPKPIPGIPYDPASAPSLLGDIPQMVRYMSQPDANFGSWLLEKARRGNSALVQIWLGFPRTRPMLVLADGPESQDLLQRGSRSWDRSGATAEFLGGLVPDHHIIMKSADERFKAQRRLLHDLMTPSFLRTVAAPIIYHQAAEGLVPLWEGKADMARGRPFAAARDVFYFALEAVIGFSFGACEHEALAPQIRTLAALSDEDRERLASADDSSGDTRDVPVDFPSAPLRDEIMSVMELTDALEKVVGVPFLDLVWRFLELTKLRKLRAHKENLIQTQLRAAAARLESRGDADDDSWFRSAVDLMVSREKRFAAKDGRKPNYLSRGLQDEVFGFLVAGHDTSSTTLCWGMKLLSKNQRVQTKLREALRAAFPQALAESRLPTMEEIHDTHMPYMDATIEEMLRHAGTVGALARDATQDTVVLGHFVPKGTTIFVLTNGPGIMTERFDNVAEAAADAKKKNKKDGEEMPRAAASMGSRRNGIWDDDDIGEFIPERWLVPTGPGGELEFDATAGPMLTFGLGPRGCFGRRLAYVMMRTMLTLVVWRFVFEETPENLSSWVAVDGLTQKPKQCYIRLGTAY